MNAQGDLHNKLAGEIVASIVKPVLSSGGTNVDVLILLESVIVGVVCMTATPDGRHEVLKAVVEGVGPRLDTAIRVGRQRPAGDA